MEKTITIKDALNFPEGTPIPRITGKVSLIWDRTTGEGKWGTWFKQAGLMEDAEGNKIVFTVWDKPDMSDYKGRTVIFRSAPNAKKPSITLKADYKDAAKMTLNVGKSAIVLTEEEETDDVPMDFDKSGAPVTAKEAQSKPQSQPAPKAQAPSVHSLPVNGVQEVKQRVMQLANLRSICDDAAAFLYPDGDEDMVKDVSSCLFIQAARENLMNKLPNNKPISTPTEDLNEEEINF